MRFLPKILCLFLLFSSLEAIEVKNENLIKDMAKTYGYYLGQNYSLDNIEKKYPNLKRELFLAKSEFNAKYLDAIKEIESRFLDVMTEEEFDEYKMTTINSVKKYLDADFTQDDALSFLEEVKNRAKGNMESPYIETLLMFNPKYQKNPALELRDNFFQKYNSKGNPKANGVDFSVKIPKSWKSEEADRPNIIRKFQSNNGYIVEDTSEFIMFFVFDLQIEVNSLSQEEADEFCDVSDENYVLRDCKKITLETLPAIVQRVKANQQVLENNASAEMVQYLIFFKDKIVAVQGQVGTLNEKVSEKVLLERFEKFKPVFDYVALSLVINDLWNWEKKFKTQE